MSASIYDSAMFRDLMQDRDTAALFTDTAELRAMLLVWGALAQAQAAVGLVPDLSARAIQRAAMEIQIDPAALARETVQNGVVIPALLAAFRSEMAAPEHSNWVHFGATSQDIIDTSLALRLRQVLVLVETRLRGILSVLGLLARTHAQTPMAGRSFGQIASPTTLGAVVADWGRPLLDLLAGLPAQRGAVLRVSLGGAAGTLSVMQGHGPQVRAGLARGLGLNDPGHDWHRDRTGLAGLSGWMTLVTGALANIGADLGLIAQSGMNEARSSRPGPSFTMVQEQNPVGAALLQAIAAHVAGLNGVMQGTVLHRQQRDDAARFAEWMSLPQICLGLGRALTLGLDLAQTLRPDPARMLANLDDGTGLIHAEALSNALIARMPRIQAQAAVNALCAEVAATGTPLPQLAQRDWPDLDAQSLFDVRRQLGEAPAEARSFAAAALAN